MVQYFPPPDCRSLLPPLLACLPTSFVSPRPPPALLPLLTPILRQRIQLLTATASSPSDSWLPLLCWESEPAQKLVDIVSNSDAFELHPVSGEIDFGDVEEFKYRRLDEETLQVRVILTDLELVVIYQWYDGGQDGSGNGWHVLEVRPLDDGVDDTLKNWFLSVSEADEKAKENWMDDALREGGDRPVSQGPSNGASSLNETQEDNDDDYWAQYDKTPGRTPAAKSPAASAALSGRQRTASEAEYFDRYAQVQPDMDNDDPSEDRRGFGESTLTGDSVVSSIQQATTVKSSHNRDDIALPNGSGVEDAHGGINQPSASAPRSRSSTVSKLEDAASTQSIAESAIMHHVSTSIKSLYRLCRSSGIERADFDRMIRIEMDTLSMMGEDD